MTAPSTIQPTITHPIDKRILSSELTSDKLIRTFKGLEIYLVTAEDSPRVMTEIGRIREVEFRLEGGGSGKPKDIDIFDKGPVPYCQLVVWDPVAQEIVSMYRYLLCRDAMDGDSRLDLATAKLFDFLPQFREQYLPKTIELGRSVVNHSARRYRLGLFAVWCGLGALVQEYPDMDYFWGKVTIATPHGQAAQESLLQFMRCYSLGSHRLVIPQKHCQVDVPSQGDSFDTARVNESIQTRLKQLKAELKPLGQSVPPILNSYLRVCDRLQYFGSVCNRNFGNVIEAGILIPIDSIKAKPRQRFIESYTSINSKRFRALDRQSSTNSLARDIDCLQDFIQISVTKKAVVTSKENALC